MYKHEFTVPRQDLDKVFAMQDGGSFGCVCDIQSNTAIITLFNPRTYIHLSRIMTDKEITFKYISFEKAI